MYSYSKHVGNIKFHGVLIVFSFVLENYLVNINFENNISRKYKYYLLDDKKFYECCIDKNHQNNF